MSGLRGVSLKAIWVAPAWNERNDYWGACAPGDVGASHMESLVATARAPSSPAPMCLSRTLVAFAARHVDNTCVRDRGWLGVKDWVLIDVGLTFRQMIQRVSAGRCASRPGAKPLSPGRPSVERRVSCEGRVVPYYPPLGLATWSACRTLEISRPGRQRPSAFRPASRLARCSRLLRP